MKESVWIETEEEMVSERDSVWERGGKGGTEIYKKKVRGIA